MLNFRVIHQVNPNHDTGRSEKLDMEGARRRVH